MQRINPAFKSYDRIDPPAVPINKLSPSELFPNDIAVPSSLSIPIVIPWNLKESVLQQLQFLA